MQLLLSCPLRAPTAYLRQFGQLCSCLRRAGSLLVLAQRVALFRGLKEDTERVNLLPTEPGSGSDKASELRSAAGSSRLGGHSPQVFRIVIWHNDHPFRVGLVMPPTEDLLPGSVHPCFHE